MLAALCGDRKVLGFKTPAKLKIWWLLFRRGLESPTERKPSTSCLLQAFFSQNNLLKTVFYKLDLYIWVITPVVESNQPIKSKTAETAGGG